MTTPPPETYYEAAAAGRITEFLLAHPCAPIPVYEPEPVAAWPSVIQLMFAWADVREAA